MNEETVQMNLKVPASLRDQLRDAAAANHRSMTAELISRVSMSFEYDTPIDRVNTLEARIFQLEMFIRKKHPDEFEPWERRQR